MLRRIIIKECASSYIFHNVLLFYQRNLYVLCQQQHALIYFSFWIKQHLNYWYTLLEKTVLQVVLKQAIITSYHFSSDKYKVFMLYENGINSTMEKYW